MMEIKDMTIDQIEARAREIEELAKADDCDIEALEAETEQLETRKKELAQMEVERRETAERVAKGTVGTTKETHEEKKAMTLNEVRNSKAYIDAYANYIKTGDDTECRAILTELSETTTNGNLPVPELVEGSVRHAWETDEIMSRVRKTNLKGIVKVGFERSASDAAFHGEGAEAPDEETLVLGIVTMTPQTIKKWITVSDEAIALNGEDFLRYVYEEITHKIVEFAAKQVVSAIESAPASSSATAIGVAQVSVAAADYATTASLILAQAALVGSISRPVAIMTKAMKAQIQLAALGANFNFDPFNGLEVLTNENATKIIVGDLGAVQCNFPDGYEVKFKYDDLSLAEADLVKIVGKLFIGMGITEPGKLAVLVPTT